MNRSLLLPLLLALLAARGANAPGQQNTLPAEPLLEEPGATETDAASTPTRRPPQPPTATLTATDTVPPSETPTPVPATETQTASPTATRTPPPSVTPTATATPTASTTPPLLSRIGAAGVDTGLVNVGLGAALAMLATWLGARIAGGRERRQRRRTRAALATAMLLELRRIDSVLRRIVALENPASGLPLDHPILESALRDVTLFDRETAARIVQFHSALRGVQDETADYRDNPLRWAGRLAELIRVIKGRAASACWAIPALVKLLERAGGTPPPHLPEAATATDHTSLPPPPLGATEGDDWTW